MPQIGYSPLRVVRFKAMKDKRGLPTLTGDISHYEKCFVSTNQDSTDRQELSVNQGTF